MLKIEKAADGKTATGVTYFDDKTGEEVFQPADLVLVCAYSLHNVHLLLLSEIGQPYDPNTGEGVVGRNYAYQMTGGTGLWFKDKVFNPFVGTGSGGMTIDDFSMSQIDFGKEGFIGGSYITGAHTGGRPIQQMSLPPGTPSWGAGLEGSRRRMVWPQPVDWFARLEHGLSRHLSRSRPDLQGSSRPSADAHDFQLEGQ